MLSSQTLPPPASRNKEHMPALAQVRLVTQNPTQAFNVSDANIIGEGKQACLARRQSKSGSGNISHGGWRGKGFSDG